MGYKRIIDLSVLHKSQEFNYFNIYVVLHKKMVKNQKLSYSKILINLIMMRY